MSINFEQFKTLHHGTELFVLPNAWDAKSALFFQEKGFPAVGTSSAAVAACLGYEDGEKMPLEDYLFVIKRILACVKIPLSVDFEMGYGETKAAILSNLLKLSEMGVAGINLEDSIIVNGKRALQNGHAFAETIDFLKNKLKAEGAALFFNIRCDTYLLNLKSKQEESALRLPLYESAGADGIFLPCINEEADIVDALKSTNLPLNVMCTPGLPDFNKLQTLGVKRASMGPFFLNKTYEKAAELLQMVVEKQSFSALL
ncbi:isocitrate lyase/PEP mutase family protein [Haliscomenobacter sp.]|uniref:isocitrate lyase/PEP mutase family protein n=1 Tax=Haliscomenobacter sp. TaxID=2717303 RepID=UPI003BA8BFBA